MTFASGVFGRAVFGGVLRAAFPFCSCVSSSERQGISCNFSRLVRLRVSGQVFARKQRSSDELTSNGLPGVLNWFSFTSLLP